MRQLRNILIAILILFLGFLLFKSLNKRGWIIPHIKSTTKVHPEKDSFQIIDFAYFEITMPNGWKDKGYRIGGHFDMCGRLNNNGTNISYKFGGIYPRPRTQTIQEILFQARNNEIIMGVERIINRTGTTIEVVYDYPLPPETSDTLKTGLLTDSIRELYPAPRIPKALLGEPNYYSLTKYNDSVYFIPIMVPVEIANSQISNIKRNGYSYNIVVPKNRETGFTKITIFKDGFRSVAFFGDDLNPIEQEILIETGLSLRFNPEYRKK